MLLTMVNGGIKDIEQDNWCASEGCITCGYGSSYINECTIHLTGFSIKFEADTEYNYAFSDGDFMKLMCQNYHNIEKLTEDEFFDWLKEQLSVYDLNSYERVNV